MLKFNKMQEFRIVEENYFDYSFDMRRGVIA